MYHVFNNMLDSLSEHKRNRKQVLIDSINDRLNNSLNVYYSELENSLSYLNSKDSFRVIKNSVRL